MTAHERFMKQALGLARKGAGRVSPNPLVGALIVRYGAVVGEGYHRLFGGPHAEVHALVQAGDLARGADIYVTLEPCSHTGKTPPCADALIRAGIARVFVGMADPNPLVSGRGIKKLETAGIAVESGILEKECRRMNESYLKYITTGMPFVVLKAAATLDGRIATRTGDSKWITCPESRSFAHRLRFEADAVMVGSGTLLADDPELTVRLGRKASKQPLRVIVDGRLRIPLASRVLQHDFASGTMIVTLPDQLVKTDPVRSAEPPISSGRNGARASMACCEALRVATVSPFAACAATNWEAAPANDAGSSPATRRRNSAARSGCAAR